MSGKVVVVTGCSSGIGMALSEEFHRRGYRVTATARRLESLDALKSRGIAVDKLDVTNRDDVERVVHSVLARDGRIDLLVNNAGYGLFGPAIEIPEHELLRQFQTNVFAPFSLIRHTAPAMFNNGGGTIINIGSISGVVTTPFAGAYCASKAALHSLSDALRMELAPFGIRVITVQPGGIESNFGNASGETARRILSPVSWYLQIKESILLRAQASQEGAMSSKEFARRLVQLLDSGRAPAVIKLGRRSFLLPLLKSLLPTRILDASFERRFGLRTVKLENIDP